MLKSLGLVSGAAALGLPLAACGSDSGYGSGGGGDDLSFMSWDTTSDSPLYTVAQNWAKSVNRGIDVQSVPLSDYETKVRAVLASGVPPTAIRINDDYVGSYYADGSLLDLRPYLERDKISPADYYDAAYKFPIQKDGAHAAWPIMGNPSFLLVNTDAFEEAGVPLPPKDWDSTEWTWDDFLDAAKKTTKPNGERWGAIVFHDTGTETVWPVSNGGYGTYSPDGTKFALSDPQATEAMQWIADLALVHKVHPDFATVSAGKQTPNWAVSQLAQGKAAIVFGVSSTIPYMRENAKVKWDIFPTPRKVARKTVNGLTVLGIPKKSKDPDAAWEFIKYCTSQDGAKVLAASRGFMPVSKASASLFVADDKAPANVALVAQAVDNAVNENFNLYMERARAIYRPVLDDVWAGRQTAAQALGGVRQKIDDILAGK